MVNKLLGILGLKLENVYKTCGLHYYPYGKNLLSLPFLLLASLRFFEIMAWALKYSREVKCMFPTTQITLVIPIYILFFAMNVIRWINLVLYSHI